MKLLRKLMLALFCAGLVAAPIMVTSHPAEARAGWTSRGGSSMGSMGSRTYQYNGGSAINRSVTPNLPSRPGYGGAYGGYGNYGYGGYHPFWSGLAGGLFGGWIGSMLFPHWGMGGGYGYGGGGGGFGGGFLSIIIWLGLIYLGYRLFRGFFHRSMGGGFGGGGFGANIGPGPGMNYMGGGFAGGGGPAPGYGPAEQDTPITVGPSDQTAFEAVLKAVQGAWSKADLSTLRHYVTPEMLSYFSEELSENNSQGLENHVEDVELINGDVREAWTEGNLEYATVALHWHARDWTNRTDKRDSEPGWLVDGDPHKPTEAQELWTFARSPGGHWLLSAIQQV
jgi:predicted lipid-binding transport protein (Tim44 family)